MNALHVPGSPYMTLNVTGASYNLTSSEKFASVNSLPIYERLKIVGETFTIATQTQTWVMYSLSGNN